MATKQSKIMKELIEWAKSLAFALIVGGLIIVFARPSLILGPSMEPTFYDKQLVLVEKVSYFLHAPRRGDIIIAQTEIPLNQFMNKSVIKRVIGLPGDHIIVQDGDVYLNDKRLDEPYLNGVKTGHDGSWIVPEESIFIMGDNRGVSNDSRRDEIGFVPYSNVKGKVYFRVFPFDDMKSY